jgi:hypothetical protein
MRRGDGNDGPHKPEWGAARLRPATNGLSSLFHTQLLSGAERSGPSTLGHFSPSLRLGVFQQLLRMFLLSAGSVRADFQIPNRGGFLFLGIYFLLGFLGHCESQTKPVEFRNRCTIPLRGEAKGWLPARLPRSAAASTLVGPVEIHFQRTANFAWKVDRYPGVNRPLLVEESLETHQRGSPSSIE